MKKVNIIWRVFTIFLIGSLCGTFLTLLVIAKRLENGNEFYIGKIKIKNSNDIELPINIEPEKKQKRRKIRTN